MATKIGDKLESIATNHTVAETQNIFDTTEEQYQDEINTYLKAEVKDSLKYRQVREIEYDSDVDGTRLAKVEANIENLKDASEDSAKSAKKAENSLKSIQETLEEIAEGTTDLSLAAEIVARQEADENLQKQIDELDRKLQNVLVILTNLGHLK